MPKPLVTPITAARIRPQYGDFQLNFYSHSVGNKEHLAFYKVDVANSGSLFTKAERMDLCLAKLLIPISCPKAHESQSAN